MLLDNRDKFQAYFCGGLFKPKTVLKTSSTPDPESK